MAQSDVPKAYQPGWKFGPAQMMAHTPKWAKAIINTLISVLALGNFIVISFPGMLPLKEVVIINVCVAVVTFFCQWCGLKNPLIVTENNEDMAITPKTEDAMLAGVSLVKKKEDASK